MTAADVERLKGLHGRESINDDIVKPDSRSVLAGSFRVVGYIQVFQTFETVGVLLSKCLKTNDGILQQNLYEQIGVSKIDLSH